MPNNNKWMSALKEWNSKHSTTGSFCIPKKGTADYDKVKELMSPPASTPAAPAKPSRQKKRATLIQQPAPAQDQGYWVRGDDGKRKWVKAGSGIKEV